MSDQTPRPGPDAPDPYEAGAEHRAGAGAEQGQQGPPGAYQYQKQDGAPAAYPAPPGYPMPGYGYPPAQKSGLALTALILGIAAVVVAMVPVVGVLSFLLGLLALIFGIVALAQRQKKAFAVTGMVLGVLGILIAAAVTAFLVFFVSRTVGDHTVQYRVSTTQPATVSYYDGHGTVDRQVNGSWEEKFSYTGLPVGAVSVNVPGGRGTCEVVLDGRRVSSNSGNGRVECVTADLGDQDR